MAKVLITLLGTGKKAKGDTIDNHYETTDYILEGKTYAQKAFISSAIAEHYGVDRIITIGTKDSMWDNLCEYYGAEESYTSNILDLKQAGKLKEADLIPLSQTIDKHIKGYGSRSIVIQNSANDDEIWAMFEKILGLLDEIDPNDELYFDITHLFRSISIFSMIIAEFAQITRGNKIAGMFYGLLENNKPSIVVNLSIYFEFLAWTRAIKSLKDYGNATELLKLLRSNDHTTKKMLRTFENFAYSLSLSDMGELQNSLIDLKKRIDLFAQSKNPINKLISTDLLQFIDRFGSIGSNRLAKFQFELSKWYSENNNHAMAYITLAEATVTAICEQNGYDLDQSGRQKARALLRRWSFSSDKQKQELSHTFGKANQIRNNIAHKLDKEQRASSSYVGNSVQNLDGYIQKLSQLIK